jgi:hypothetical protein
VRLLKSISETTSVLEGEKTTFPMRIVIGVLGRDLIIRLRNVKKRLPSYPIFLAIAVTLWILLKSIVDDGKLTLDEGVSIIVIYLLGILLFDQLSLIF